MFPVKQFEFFQVPENDISYKSFESMEVGILKKQPWFSDSLDLEFREIDPFFSDTQILGSVPEPCKQQVQLFKGLEDSFLEAVSPPRQSCHQDINKFTSVQSKTSEIVELENEITDSFPFASLGIVNITKRSRRMNGKKINFLSYESSYTKASSPSPRLSTAAIVRSAGEKFIQSCSGRGINDLSQVSNPFACSFMGLSNGESRDVELVQDLLACAEKAGQQQFESASKLISRFDKLSFTKGNPVQRLVYYFADALREKINQESGSKHIGLEKKPTTDLQEVLMRPNPGIIAFHQRVPFSQFCQFTAVQTIIENLREAKKVHIIDFEIRNGMQWTVLMEALAAQCPYSLEHLKITTVCTRSKSVVEDTGKRLKSFAQSMNLPFTFKVIMVPNMLNLSIEVFELNNEEEVAVYLPFLLSTLVANPGHLDSLMGVIRIINPCVTIISEVEANHNSPAFVNRFIEALFYYSALFDSMADCMADDEENRKVTEGYFSMTIRNIVVDEGAERIFRHISIDVWTAYLARFGMVEMELSSASRYQADLLVQKFDCGSYCTLDMDRKGMIIGWKGEAIFSVSAWTFL